MRRLMVESEGLRAAAASSETLAASLSPSAAAGGSKGSQPSHAAVSEVDAAVSSAAAAQSVRIRQLAASLRAGGLCYEFTDDVSAIKLAESM
ncbi:hypothetical protein [Mycolicibacterium thermoresistibile]